MPATCIHLNSWFRCQILSRGGPSSTREPSRWGMRCHNRNHIFLGSTLSYAIRVRSLIIKVSINTHQEGNRSSIIRYTWRTHNNNSYKLNKQRLFSLIISSLMHRFNNKRYRCIITELFLISSLCLHNNNTFWYLSNNLIIKQLLQYKPIYE